MGLTDPPAVAVTELAVVVLSALAGPPDDSLAELLGPVAAGALRGQLLRDARRWAATTAGSEGPGAFEANSPAAAAAALEGHAGPVAFVAPDVPGLDAALTEALLGDLADGIGMVFASTYDATPYLLAMPALDDELLRLVGGRQDELFAAVAARQVAVGMLRSERRLATAADARAVAADPRTPPELGVLLSVALDVRARRGA